MFPKHVKADKNIKLLSQQQQLAAMYIVYGSMMLCSLLPLYILKQFARVAALTRKQKDLCKTGMEQMMSSPE